MLQFLFLSARIFFMVLFRTIWGNGRKEMEDYLVRFMVKGYNWSVQEMVVPKERAIRMLSDGSLLILRMEIQ